MAVSTKSQKAQKIVDKAIQSKAKRETKQVVDVNAEVISKLEKQLNGGQSAQALLNLQTLVKEANTVYMLLLQQKVTKTMIKNNTSNELLNAIEMVGQIQAVEKVIGDAKDQLKKEIRKIMEKTKVDEIVSGAFKANYTEYVSETFDQKAFEAKHPKMFKNFLTPSEKTRFNVSAAKKTK